MYPEHFFEEMTVLIPLIRNKLIPHTSTYISDLLPMHYEILGLLSLKGPRSMKELSRFLGIAAPNLTFLVNRLVQLEMAERVPDPTDRRVIKLEIRPKGIEAVSKGREFLVRQLDVSLKQFTEEEKNELNTAIQILKKLFFRNIEGS